MHVSVMESSALPDSYDSMSNVIQQMNDLPAPIRVELAGRQSTYMTNMILPEIVKSSKNFPLGPDCIITSSEVPDQSVLLNVDLYWLISMEKGCVECKVLVHDSATKKRAITHDPRVIITRKTRRFEAYCCGICKANFVTVVQALLHMKAYHRPNKKILIQDQNVFHDIEKAMEVPPVPLPWYVTKRAPDQGLQLLPGIPNQAAITTVTAKGSANDGTNPVTCLLQAIVKEYGKQVHVVFFGKEFTDVTVQFEDGTSVLAHLPDLANPESHKIGDIDTDEKLDFKVQRSISENDAKETCIVRVNNPALAQRLIATALRQGVASGSGTDLVGQDDPALRDGVKVPLSVKQSDHVVTPEKDDKAVDSPLTQVKLDSRGRPSKTVRFMVGSPDSDEEASSSASEKAGGRDSISPITSNLDKDAGTNDNVKTSEQSDNIKKHKEDEGLKGVVNQLISTASKGLNATAVPVSPVPLTNTTSITSVKENVSTTPSTQSIYIPKNLSVPNLPTMTVPTSAVSNVLHVPAATSLAMNPGMIRVQSWGAGFDPQRFTLSTYAPHTPQSFDHMTTDQMRSTMLTVGRGFTYAEKIKLMKKLNDEDSLITQKHVRGAGKLMEAEGSLKHAGRKSSSSSVTDSDYPLSVTTARTKPKLKKSESEPSFDVETSAAKLLEMRRKRKSKYDVDQFMPTGTKALDLDLRPTIGRHPAKSAKLASDESTSEDSEAESSHDHDENPPSLLNLMQRNFSGAVPRTAILTTQAVQNPRVPATSSYPSMLSSEYYGSGEWASAAMQTLQKLQMVDSSPAEKPENSEKSKTADLQDSEDDKDNGHSTSPFVSAHLVDSLDKQTSSSSDATPSLSAATMAENTVDTIMALAKRISAEQSQTEMSKARSQMKRSFSPLLSADEKEIMRSRPGTKANDRTNKKMKKEKHSRNSSKTSSDSNMRKRQTSSEVNIKPSAIVAEKGDSLEFTATVTGASLQKNDEISLKFCKNAESDNEAPSDNSMGMQQLFKSSVETVMRVRYIEKVNRCRVCGYSLPAEDNDTAKMSEHVVEHSLKELLEAGCNGKSS